jgi:hypothetical protein
MPAPLLGVFPVGRLGILLLLLAAAVGCGSPATRLVPVEGVVHWGTKVMTEGTVVFHPDSRRGNRSRHQPHGQIDAHGRYVMATAGKPGVPPGHYRVTILASRPPDSKHPYTPPEWSVPLVYIDPVSTPLRVEVVESPGPDAYDLHIEP